MSNVISRTPVRVSLFGGGTDYREYYHRNRGAVLGTTIDKYVYVSVNTLSDFFDYKYRVSYSKSELVHEIDEIVHPSVRECLRYKNPGHNVDVHIFADLPARTGLGSSSTFTVGLLHALAAKAGKMVSKATLAKDACHVEHTLIQENVGSQDQYHAAFGGFNVIEFSEHNINVRPVIISKEKLQALDSCLMMFFTGMSRHAHVVVKEQIDKTQNKSNDGYLEQMLKQVEEAEEVISHSDTDQMIQKLGAMLDHGWHMKKQLSSQISNSVIDDAYTRAKAAGAFGGKVCGAGGGGFLLLMVSPEKQNSVRNALKDMAEVKFRMENEGSSIIYLRH